MRKIELFGISVLLLAVAGCASTSVVTEFDAEGRIVKTTETTESVAKEVRRSLESKTVAIWTEGWRAEITLSAATAENPTPTGTVNAGNIGTGYLSVRKDQKNTAGIAEIIRAMRSGMLEVGTGGVENSAGD